MGTTTSDLLVYKCNQKECGFEHWDGIDYYAHLKQSHGLKEKAALTIAVLCKRERSKLFKIRKLKK